MKSARRIGVASLLAAIVALALSPLLRSQSTQSSQTSQAPASPTQPQFTTGVNAVTVSVNVFDKQGQSVDNLRVQDFEVLENKRRQTIQAFKYVALPTRPIFDTKPTHALITPEDVDKVAVEDEVRVVVVFLDYYHVRAANSLISRQQIAHFMQTQLGSRDLVAVMTPLLPLAALNFTQDRFASIPLLNEFLGRKFDYAIGNEFEQRYSQCPPLLIERVRREVTMSALQGLVERMATMGATRKAILFLSEGFSERQMIPNTPGFIPHGDPGDPVCKSLATEAQDYAVALHDLSRAAVRANATIYAFDPRGFGGQEFTIDENISTAADSRAIRDTREVLEGLAGETDGAVIYRPTDENLGLARITRESSGYYLLAYNSTLPSEGKFHEIAVNVNRRDVTIHARKGYWATPPPTSRPTTSAPAIPVGVSRALATLAQPPVGGLIRTWIGAARGSSGVTRVTFQWEPDANARNPQPASSGLQVSLIAGTDTNTYVSSSSPGPIAFDAPAGPMHVVVTVRNQAGEMVDRRTDEFVVPDFSRSIQGLSTPVVSRARSALEWDRMLTANAPPTAVREFRRADRVLVRFATYGAGSTAPVARLLNTRGARVRDLPVVTSTLRADVAPPGNSGDIAMHQLELPVSSLAPADYVIEIVAPIERDPPVVELVGIRIVQ